MKRNSSSRGLLAAIPLLIFLSGCNGNDADVVRAARQNKNKKLKASTSSVDHLGQASGYIASLVELDAEAANRQISYHLNAWLEASDSEPDWETSPLLEGVPGEFKTLVESVSLDSKDILPQDLDHIRETYLHKRITQWVATAPLRDPTLKSWINKDLASTDDRARNQLATACKLFEWTIRNLRLEADQLSDEQRQLVPADLQEDAVGYRQTTLECLWRGTGDGLQRSRVFLRLCRAAGLDAVMLGTEDDEGTLQPRLCGVRIEDKMYLFDASVGIHVPGPDQSGIATLKQAQDDAVIIRRMGIPGLFEYPISNQDLKEVKAMFDPAIESLAWRMTAVQKGLAGNNRMRLAFDAGMPARIKSVASISDVAFWPIGLQARVYQQKINRAKLEDARFLYRFSMRWGMLDEDFPLAKGRWRHLTGQFDMVGETEGARKTYMEMRVPDKEINDLPYDVKLQKRFGARVGDLNPQQFDLQIKMLQAQYRLGKQLATFWLAIIQFDDEQFENAATWHEKRVLGREYESPWADAARYNVGRAYEQLDRLDDAIDKYKSDDDTQEHGNRIRARLVTRLKDAQKS